MEAYKREGILNNSKEERVISMSSYSDLNTLLLVSDYLITDYSSIIFEYCLRKKPMIFYAYDLDQFTDGGRGFYQPYKEFVPGPVVKDTQEILELLSNNQFDYEKKEAFVHMNYQYLDGKSAERIYLHIFQS
jgi:CDP-ribitol ribitolphosphotransferase